MEQWLGWSICRLPDGRAAWHAPIPWEQWQYVHGQEPSSPLDAWKSVLDVLHVDKPAQLGLWALAQHSPGGLGAANALVGKLIKKMVGNDLPDNVSAFINKCVTSARNELGAERHGVYRAGSPLRRHPNERGPEYKGPYW
jgi:hypothetical protein